MLIYYNITLARKNPVILDKNLRMWDEQTFPNSCVFFWFSVMYVLQFIGNKYARY